MGKTIHRAGVVVSGDYSGKSIYMRNDYSFMIISNDENGKIIVKSLFPTRYSILKEISKTTVDHYEDVSAIETGADASAVAKGLIFSRSCWGFIRCSGKQISNI